MSHHVDLRVNVALQKRKLLKEVWSGKEVYLSHLRVFGSVSHVDINANERSKMNEKEKKNFFTGYAAEHLL